MCGIIGYIGTKEAKSILISGIKILLNRGYDSVGMATIDSNNEFVVTKEVSTNTTSDCIDRLESQIGKHENSTIGI